MVGRESRLGGILNTSPREEVIFVGAVEIVSLTVIVVKSMSNVSNILLDGVAYMLFHWWLILLGRIKHSFE